MDTNYTLGGLLPIWIICAPLLAAVIMMFTAPKPTSHNSRDRRDERDIRDGRQYGDIRNIQETHDPLYGSAQPAAAGLRSPVTGVPIPGGTFTRR